MRFVLDSDGLGSEFEQTPAGSSVAQRLVGPRKTSPLS